MELADLNNEFGDLDLFLLDLLLKGHVSKGAKVLDAGCGAGRNAYFFLKQGYSIKAIDHNQNEVSATNLMSRAFIGQDVALRGDLLNLPYDSRSFDLIVCSRVLHFVRSEEEFKRVLKQFSDVLRPDGILYLSMNSNLNNSASQMSNTGQRFLLSAETLSWIYTQWKKLLDHRTVVFEGGISETTLILKKREG